MLFLVWDLPCCGLVGNRIKRRSVQLWQLEGESAPEHKGPGIGDGLYRFLGNVSLAFSELFPGGGAAEPPAPSRFCLVGIETCDQMPPISINETIACGVLRTGP